MNKIYYLKTCSTCNRIIKELGGLNDFEKQNIKVDLITDDQLEQMKSLAGSFEALFSKKSRKFRELGLNEMTLTEQDYKAYILKEYTFLKRPVIIIKDEIFIGNSKGVVENAKTRISKM